MKRKRRNRFKLLITLLIFIVIGFLAWPFFVKILISNTKKETPSKEKPIVKNENVTTSVNMVMVGDLLIHENVFKDMKTSSGYDFSPMFTEVTDFIKGYDLAFYNQETPFAGEKLVYDGYPAFNTPSEAGDAMLNMGFNLVSLATNHTMDKGVNGAINSLTYWNSKNVLTAGSYLSEDDRKKVVIKEKNGIKYTLLAYATLSNMGTSSSQPYLLDMYDKEKVKEDIERVRDKVDVLIVSMHWGTEYATKPNDNQKEIAEYLSSLGVDIVIGTHTHSIEPIEYVGKTLVFYSLGNFASSQLYDDNLVGLMPTLKITKTVENKVSKIEISDVEARMVFTYYKGCRTINCKHTDHKVIPFSKITTADFPKYMDFYNKYKKIIQSLDPSIKVEEIE